MLSVTYLSSMDWFGAAALMGSIISKCLHFLYHIYMYIDDEHAGEVCQFKVRPTEASRGVPCSTIALFFADGKGSL